MWGWITSTLKLYYYTSEAATQGMRASAQYSELIFVSEHQAILRNWFFFMISPSSLHQAIKYKKNLHHFCKWEYTNKETY